MMFVHVKKEAHQIKRAAVQTGIVTAEMNIAAAQTIKVFHYS
jgi:hypothetical protein